MKDIVVLYHINCNDGFGGAWVARKKFGDKADYIGVIHHDPPPLGLIDKEVYIIDFSYPAEDTEKILKAAKSLTVIDHHVTAKGVVESLPSHVYDIDHSGAVLAWNYFFPGEKVPMLLKYVEDGDLWKFELPESREFFAFSMTMLFDFKRWDELIEDFEDEKKKRVHLDEGKMILEYQKKMIDELMKEGEEVSFEGYSALAVNSAMLPSQLGNAIVNEGYDMGIVWFNSGGGITKVSLRSDKDGDVDVGKIAKKHGGGGHKSASGFVINPGEEFPWQHKNM